jgi:LPS-assembly protein
MITAKLLRNKLIIIFIGLVLSVSSFAGIYSSYKENIAKVSQECQAKYHDGFSVISFIKDLWQPDNNKKCGGYLKGNDLSFINKFNDEKVHFKADNQSLITKKGASYLTGNVKFGYKDLLLESDSICYLKQDNQDIILANGPVRLTKDKIFIIASRALWYVDGGRYLEQVSYKLDAPKSGVGAAWGEAEEFWSESENESSMRNASFSYCGVDNPDWVLEAGYLDFDTDASQGYASDVWLRFFGTRLIYMPVILFPLSSKRQSGFLHPHFGQNTDSGWYAQFPYYWNLAPNYDLTTTALSYSNRGLGYAADFRFLTSSSVGNITLFQVFNDNEFSKFKTSNVAKYSSSSNTSYQVMASDLSEYSLSRRFIKFQDKTKISDNVKVKLNYSWASDTYFREDFPLVKEQLSERKLPRDFLLDFEDGDWQVEAAWQDDKLMQTVNQSVLQGIFSTKPSITAVYHHIFDDIPNLEINTDFNFVDFAPASGSIPTTSNNISIYGKRSYLIPSITVYSFDSIFNGKIQFGLDKLWYSWSDSGVDNNDSKFFTWFSFEKRMPLFYSRGEDYFTIQPRVLYRWIPYKNQSSLPVIDSSFPADSYQQLFRVNRFIGHDRIGDTNSITMAVESSWFKPHSDRILAKFDVGINYDFSLHKVCLSDDCAEDIQAVKHFSPLQIRSVYFDDNFKYSFIFSVDSDFESVNTMYGDITHDFKGGQAKLYYNYAKYLSLYPMDLDKSKVIGLEINQAFNQNWKLYAKLQFSREGKQSYGYLAGINYNSCCLDANLGFERRLIGNDINGANEYQNNFSFRFSLSGLGG